MLDRITKDLPDQEKMVLQADIMYKSNWQAGTLKGMYPSAQNDSGKMEPLMLAPKPLGATSGFAPSRHTSRRRKSTARKETLMR